jgi:hypothetical protein
MKRTFGWSWVVLFISAFLIFILQICYCHLVKKLMKEYNYNNADLVSVPFVISPFARGN